MGSAFSRSTEPKHELEKITEEVKQINEYIRGLDEQKTTAVKVTFGSTAVAVIAVSIGVLSQKPEINSIAVCVVGLIVLLLLYYFFVSIVRRIYSYRTNKQYTLKEVLLKKRSDILTKVKESENFNTARELILKYGTEEDLRAVDSVNKVSTIPPIRPTPSSKESAVKPTKPVELKTPAGPPGTPFNGAPPTGSNLRIPPGMLTPAPAFRTPTVRPLPAITRTPIDKVLDFFIGDGPSFRYALICSNCNTHNGLALPEEFDRIAYYCARCNHFNSRKKPSTAPLSARPSLSMSALPSRSPSIASRASVSETDVENKVPVSYETPKMPKADDTRSPQADYNRKLIPVVEAISVVTQKAS